MSNLNVENLSKIVQTGNAEALLGGGSVGSAEGGGGPTFSDVLRQSVGKVNEMQTQANTAINELVAGRSKNIHETLLAVERADDSLKLMMQVRNKILDAYREIMRMQV